MQLKILNVYMNKWQEENTVKDRLDYVTDILIMECKITVNSNSSLQRSAFG